MPSFRLSCLIVLAWLGGWVWFIAREYLPHWRASDLPPTPLVELADEAAPRYTSWGIYRDNKRLGSLSTRLTYQAGEQGYEFESRVNSLELNVESPLAALSGVRGIQIRIPTMITTGLRSATGELKRLKIQSKLDFGLQLTATPNTGMERWIIEAKLTGDVRDGFFQGETELKHPLGEATTQLQAIPVPASQFFNPLEPYDRIDGIFVGKRWKISLLDPISVITTEAVAQTTESLLKKYNLPKIELPGRNNEPKILTAHVEGKEDYTWQNASHNCYVIRYNGDGFQAVSFVRVEDNRLLKQEVTSRGEVLRLIRE